MPVHVQFPRLRGRRKKVVPVATEHVSPPRAAPLTHPATTEPEYTIEQLIFLRAIQDYKEREHRPFPTWCEILAIAHALGYRKVAEPTELPTFKRGR